MCISTIFYKKKKQKELQLVATPGRQLETDSWTNLAFGRGPRPKGLVPLWQGKGPVQCGALPMEAGHIPWTSCI